MSNDLIAPAELAHLPGAPFDADEVDDAAAAIRGELGWHIAPEREETVVLDVTHCDPVLRLPSRHVVSVEEIRNTTTDDIIAATGYKVSIPLARVRRGSSWPSGYGAIEVDLTHGFTACPPELRPIIAQRILRSRGEGTVTKERIDDYAVEYSSSSGVDEGAVPEDVLTRYSLRWGVT